MISAAKAIQVSFLFFSITLTGAAGCATASGGRAERRDQHTSARISGDAARVLVAGPALLMHVDVEGREDLSLYAVARKTGTEADCAAGQAGERRRVRPGVSNRVNITVAANQAICIAAAPSSRSTAVMWHARRIEGGSVAAGQALAFDAPAR
jgi:hypothetical protein